MAERRPNNQERPYEAVKSTAVWSFLYITTYHKITAVLTAILFLFNIVGTDAAWALNSETAAYNARLKQASESTDKRDLNIGDFEIPTLLGSVKDRFRGSGGTIIYIQDAHCNYGAQQAISDIIGHLNSEYGVDLINLEGGEGDYDLSLFTDIQDKRTRRRISDHFVKEGRVSGPEYFAINNPEKVTLFGIEDPDLYIDNLNVYKDSLEYVAGVNNTLDYISSKVSTLKKHIYSKPLIELDGRYEGFKAKTIELKEFISYLLDFSVKKKISLENFPNIRALYSAISREDSINFKRANIERNKLVDKLKNKLSDNAADELALKSFLFKSGQLSQGSYYTYLKTLAEKYRIDLKTSPNLLNYITYIKHYERADKQEVFTEIEDLFELIAEAEFTNETQKNLFKISKHSRILKDIFNIKATRKDIDYFNSHKHEFEISAILEFLKEISLRNGESPHFDESAQLIDLYRDKILKFYHLALARDKAFIRNINLSTNRYNKDASIVVAGGFHTENLTSLLKENNTSYVVIRPNFNNKDNYKCPYYNLLSGGLSDMEEEIIAAISAIAIASLFTGLIFRIDGSQALAEIQRIKARLLGERTCTLRIEENGRKRVIGLRLKGSIITKNELSAQPEAADAELGENDTKTLLARLKGFPEPKVLAEESKTELLYAPILPVLVAVTPVVVKFIITLLYIPLFIAVSIIAFLPAHEFAHWIVLKSFGIKSLELIVKRKFGIPIWSAIGYDYDEIKKLPHWKIKRALAIIAGPAINLVSFLIIANLTGLSPPALFHLLAHGNMRPSDFYLVIKFAAALGTFYGFTMGAFYDYMNLLKLPFVKDIEPKPATHKLDPADFIGSGKRLLEEKGVELNPVIGSYLLVPGTPVYKEFIDFFASELENLPFNDKVGESHMMRPDAVDVTKRLVAYIREQAAKEAGQGWGPGNLERVRDIFRLGGFEVFKNEIYSYMGIEGICYSVDLGIHLDIVLNRYMVTQSPFEVRRIGTMMINLETGGLMIGLGGGQLSRVHDRPMPESAEADETTVVLGESSVAQIGIPAKPTDEAGLTLLEKRILTDREVKTVVRKDQKEPIVFGGKYRVVKTIEDGEEHDVFTAGAHGRIYMAQDGTGSPVVIKAGYLPSMDRRYELLKEIYLLRTLKGVDGVVNFREAGVYDYIDVDGETDRHYYIVMDYSGVSLRSMLNTSGVTPGDMVVVAERIAGILDELHKRGIVHRDVQAGNMIVPVEDSQYRYNKTVLVDFVLVQKEGTPRGDDLVFYTSGHSFTLLAEGILHMLTHVGVTKIDNPMQKVVGFWKEVKKDMHPQLKAELKRVTSEKYPYAIFLANATRIFRGRARIIPFIIPFIAILGLIFAQYGIGAGMGLTTAGIGSGLLAMALPARIVDTGEEDLAPGEPSPSLSMSRRSMLSAMPAGVAAFLSAAESVQGAEERGLFSRIFTRRDMAEVEREVEEIAGNIRKELEKEVGSKKVMLRSIRRLRKLRRYAKKSEPLAKAMTETLADCLTALDYDICDLTSKTIVSIGEAAIPGLVDSTSDGNLRAFYILMNILRSRRKTSLLWDISRLTDFFIERCWEGPKPDHRIHWAAKLLLYRMRYNVMHKSRDHVTIVPIYTIPPKRVFSVLANREFQLMTQDLEPANLLGVATSVGNFLWGKDMPLTDGSVKDVLGVKLAARKKSSPQPIIANDRSLIVLGYAGFKSEIDELETLLGKMGIENTESDDKKIQPFFGKERKEEAYTAIGQAQRKTTILCTWHGNQHSAIGIISDIDDINNPSEVQASTVIPEDLGRAVSDYAKNHDGDLSDLVIVIDGCYPFKFVSGLINYFIQASEKGIFHNRPLIIVTAEEVSITPKSNFVRSLKTVIGKAEAGKNKISVSDMYKAMEESPDAAIKVLYPPTEEESEKLRRIVNKWKPASLPRETGVPFHYILLSDTEANPIDSIPTGEDEPLLTPYPEYQIAGREAIGPPRSFMSPARVASLAILGVLGSTLISTARADILYEINYKIAFFTHNHPKISAIIIIAAMALVMLAVIAGIGVGIFKIITGISRRSTKEEVSLKEAESEEPDAPSTPQEAESPEPAEPLFSRKAKSSELAGPSTVLAIPDEEWLSKWPEPIQRDIIRKRGERVISIDDLDFRRQRKLGEGGFGTALLVPERDTDRKYVVKMYSNRDIRISEFADYSIWFSQAYPQPAKDNRAPQYYAKGRHTFHLNMDDLMVPADYGEIFSYVIMDYVPGQSLYRFLGERDREEELREKGDHEALYRNWRNKLRLALSVAEGVLEHHREGILMHDLKAGNMNIEPGEGAYLDMDNALSGKEPIFLDRDTMLPLKYDWFNDFWNIPQMAVNAISPAVSELDAIKNGRFIKRNSEGGYYIDSTVATPFFTEQWDVYAFGHLMFGIFNHRFANSLYDGLRLRYRIDVIGAKEKYDNAIEQFIADEIANSASFGDMQDTVVEVYRIISRLINDDRTVRYQDMEKVVEEIKACLEHLDRAPPAVTPETPSEDISAEALVPPSGDFPAEGAERPTTGMATTTGVVRIVPWIIGTFFGMTMLDSLIAAPVDRNSYFIDNIVHDPIMYLMAGIAILVLAGVIVGILHYERSIRPEEPLREPRDIIVVPTQPEVELAKIPKGKRAKNPPTIIIGDHALQMKEGFTSILVKPGWTYKLPNEGSIVVGRSRACDLVLDNIGTASSRHARITRENGNIYVEDLDSTNGTRVPPDTTIEDKPEESVVSPAEEELAAEEPSLEPGVFAVRTITGILLDEETIEVRERGGLREITIREAIDNLNEYQDSLDRLMADTEQLGSVDRAAVICGKVSAYAREISKKLEKHTTAKAVSETYALDRRDAYIIAQTVLHEIQNTATTLLTWNDIATEPIYDEVAGSKRIMFSEADVPEYVAAATKYITTLRTIFEALVSLREFKVLEFEGGARLDLGLEPAVPEGADLIGKLYNENGNVITDFSVTSETSNGQLVIRRSDNGLIYADATGENGMQEIRLQFGAYREPIDFNSVKVRRGGLRGEETEAVESIVSSLLESYVVIELQENPYIIAAVNGGTDTFYVTPTLISNPITYFHERGEKDSILQKISREHDVPVHVLLRGLGNKNREFISRHAALEISDMSADRLVARLGDRLHPYESALIKYNENQGRNGWQLIYGLQDKVFGNLANEDFTKLISGEKRRIVSELAVPEELDISRLPDAEKRAAFVEIMQQLRTDMRDPEYTAKDGRGRMCLAHCLNLKERLLKRGVSSMIYTPGSQFLKVEIKDGETIEPHYWLVTSDGWVLDAFPDGLGTIRYLVASAENPEGIVALHAGDAAGYTFYRFGVISKEVEDVFTRSGALSAARTEQATVKAVAEPAPLQLEGVEAYLQALNEPIVRSSVPEVSGGVLNGDMAQKGGILGGIENGLKNGAPRYIIMLGGERLIPQSAKAEFTGAAQAVEHWFRYEGHGKVEIVQLSKIDELEGFLRESKAAEYNTFIYKDPTMRTDDVHDITSRVFIEKAREEGRKILYHANGMMLTIRNKGFISVRGLTGVALGAMDLMQDVVAKREDDAKEDLKRLYELLALIQGMSVDEMMEDVGNLWAETPSEALGALVLGRWSIRALQIGRELKLYYRREKEAQRAL